MTIPSKELAVILEVAGEGGAYTILGEKHEGNWRFCHAADGSDEWLLADDDAESPQPFPAESSHESTICYFDTLDRVLEEINSCWPHLKPLKVHPAFVEDIWRRAV